jgi:hypothetical protein
MAQVVQKLAKLCRSLATNSAFRRLDLKQPGQGDVHGGKDGVSLEPAVGVELDIGAQVRVDQLAAPIEIIANLRAYSVRAGLVGAENRKLPAVGGQLLVVVGDQANEELLREELACGKIEMRIDSVGVIG